MATKYKVLEIRDNIDKPSEVISHTGPIHIFQSVENLRVKAIVAAHGFINMDGVDGSMQVAIESLSVSDPRTQSGDPTDAFHLGGITGQIGTINGDGLQGDMVKLGRGARGLSVGLSVGHAIKMEEAQVGGGAAGDKHQDGWQLMGCQKVTVQRFEYYGGPSSNHAGFFCNPNDPGHDTSDPTVIVDCVILGGLIVTKATGVALGACTRCGARNMHIEAKYPWRVTTNTKQPIDAGNTKIVVGR